MLYIGVEGTNNKNKNFGGDAEVIKTFAHSCLHVTPENTEGDIIEITRALPFGRIGPWISILFL